jgi:hypothetical protein
MSIAATFLAALLALAPASPDDIDAGRKLLDEGDALADKGETTEAEIRYQQAMEKLLPGLRHLPFQHEVKRDVTAREDIGKYLLEEFEKEMGPEELRAQELTYKAFGLLPTGLDYKETVLEVYTQEVGAFYDPETDTMHLIKESGGGRDPGLLESLLGRKKGFDKEETKVVIAHELTHALADQHYDLDKMLDEVVHDDDRELALSALIEGEATFTMMGAQMGDWTGEQTAALPADRLGFVFNLLSPMLTSASGPALRKAPPIISESMLFPYLRGLVFCAKLVNDHGWSSIDDAYRNPPLSTEQILHPEKYEAEPDPPTAIDLGELAPGEGWKEVARNVMGEFQTSVLLRKDNGKTASEGWDGDQYAAFEGPDGKLGLVWLTTWDTEDDAREFLQSFAAYRHVPMENTDGSGTLEIVRDGKTWIASRRGKDVAVVEGFEAESAHKLLDAAFGAKKAEKTR